MRRGLVSEERGGDLRCRMLACLIREGPVSIPLREMHCRPEGEMHGLVS